MKLLFSEHKSDYPNYIFPYAIWAFPEPGETPAQLFASGFLPASRELDRFYMCRHIRIDLQRFKPSSENRRILRKGEGVTHSLVKRDAFDYSKERKAFYKNYADIKFGKDVMTFGRLDSLFNSPITSHVLVYRDEAADREIGSVTLFLQPPGFAYYYYSFYDLNYYARNLGMFMMTSAVQYFAEHCCRYIYLGSCYSRNALYKTQFSGAEFFNGYRWSQDLDELKYLIRRDSRSVSHHLLETEDYHKKFSEGGLDSLPSKTLFSMRVKTEV